MSDFNPAQLLDILGILSGLAIIAWIIIGMPYAPGIAGGRR